MATSPLGGFANLSQYAQAAMQPVVSPLDALLQGFGQGQQIRNLPQTLQEQQLAKQLEMAIQQAKLRDLQQPNVINTSRGAFVADPTAEGGFRIISGTAPLDIQRAPFVGFGGTAENPLAVYDDPRLGLFTRPAPAGVSGSLAPKTRSQRGKGLLIENEKTGSVSYEFLNEGESIPDGFRSKSNVNAGSDIRNIDSFRKEVASNAIVKQFVDVNKSIQRIDTAMEESRNTNNFTVVDQVLISTFNRLLEPDSVTMVSEYARTTADAPLINRIKANIDRITKGGRLGAEEREALSRLSHAIYDKSLSNYSNTIDFFQDTALRRGWDPRDIFQPITGQEVRPTEGSTPAPSPVPSPITQPAPSSTTPKKIGRFNLLP